MQQNVAERVDAHDAAAAHVHGEHARSSCPGAFLPGDLLLLRATPEDEDEDSSSSEGAASGSSSLPSLSPSLLSVAGC